MLKKLTDRIFYLPHDQKTDRPALGLIVGKKCSLIVDGGNSPAHATEFLEKVKQLNVSPLRYLAITHWHWDHTFGISAMNVLTISHCETKKQLDYMRTLKWDDDSLDSRVKSGEEIEFCRDMIKLEMPSREELRIKSPELIFTEKIEIDLGNITCLIEHVGGEHAKDSSIIYIPEEKVMFLGDCICPDLYSGDWSFDRIELAKLLDKINKYDVNYYVTSHNEPETYEELWGYLNELKAIGDMVGDEFSLEKAKTIFKENRNREPNEDETIMIGYFISGNIKRQGK
ncbi:MAG TPA: MBL fold metallo-hydrolase [Bacillales bacterium]|nr:MBL fold metallo-hydrolase [Bacillales bacterium]